MRILLGLLFVIATLSAEYYPSYHQLAPTKGLVNELKNFTIKNFSFYNESIRFSVYGEAKKYKNKWCGNKFYNLKVYVPKGIKKTYITMTPIPNSSYFVLAKFIPQNARLPEGYTIDWTNPQETKSTDQADYFSDRPYLIWARHGGILFEFPRFKDTILHPEILENFPGGWIYFKIIQASQFVNSQFGHIDNPSMGFAVKYYYDKSYKESLKDFLKTTKFDPQTGDPIDHFLQIQEKAPTCNNYGALSTISGVPDSDITGYEFQYGITRDPNLPVLDVGADKTAIKTGDSINVKATVNVGNKPLQGVQNIIDVELNQNTTVSKTGILLTSDLGCAKLQNIQISDDLQKGEILYSDNGNNWYKEKNNSAIAGNIQYVGYFIENGVDVNKKITMDIIAKIDDSCTPKNIFTLQYRLDNGDVKELTKSLYFSRAETTTSGGDSYTGGSAYTLSQSMISTSSSSGTKSRAQIYCESHGGTWADGTCLSGKKTPVEDTSHIDSTQDFPSMNENTSISSSSSGTKSRAQIYCESHGGTWADGTCLSGKKTPVEDTSHIDSTQDFPSMNENTSISSSSSGTKSRAQIYCESHGGTWADGTCLSGKKTPVEDTSHIDSTQDFPSMNENTSISSSSSGTKSRAQIYCESHGGTWADGTCLSGKKTPVEDTSHIDSTQDFPSMNENTSISSSSSGTKSRAQIYCESHGGTWADGTCLSDGSDSSSSSSSKHQVGDEISGVTQGTNSSVSKIFTIAQKLAKRSLSIDGYFAHYGSGSFDWMYRSAKSGKVYKLEGMDKNGYFKWTNLTDFFSKSYVRNGKIIIGSLKSTRDVNNEKTSAFIKDLENKEFPIDGYFAHYGSGSFDWIYKSAKSEKVWKLEGMDESGYFKWTKLTDYFNEIRVQDDKIIIGNAFEETSSDTTSSLSNSVRSESSISSSLSQSSSSSSSTHSSSSSMQSSSSNSVSTFPSI
ncbi:hypothetical protein [Nitratiruptor tergarcus]|uniref:hypothetical protein n=1 Tax=Nitratiruptor tergarcus TaxID=269259 RepID=UPI0024931A9A|nr:hypothetical protein [Nitratiruptor tergarcus]